jgi:hypothetical protein
MIITRADVSKQMHLKEEALMCVSVQKVIIMK